MDYKKALENLRQYNREYSTGNELLESVVACINYIIEDSENESKDDLIEVAEIVKNDLLLKVEPPEYTHCDFPQRILYAPKGAKLRLISDRGNVLVVEYNGEKFPVNKKEVDGH